MDYLDKTKFQYEIILSQGKGYLTDKAARYMVLIGNGLINSKWYDNQDVKDDCLSNGIYTMLKNWKSYDRKKTDNAFAYFSEIFKRGMALEFNKNDKYYKNTSRIVDFYEKNK